MRKNIVVLLGLMVLLTSCGSTEGVEFNQVTGIVPGNGAGTALSGDFAVVFFYTSNGCDRHSEFQIPASGTQTSLDVTVTQDGGALIFEPIHVTLRGSVSFEGRFELGGADLLDVGDAEQNILRMVRLTGSFQQADVFTASGQERLVGSLEGEDVDCTYTFRLDGTRKAS